MKIAILGLAAIIAAGLPQTCLADDLPATEQFKESTVEFKIDGTLGTLMLTVAGPNGFYASATARSASPSIDLRRYGDYDDGEYTYHLTASTDGKIKLRTPLDDGRDQGPTTEILKGVATSGTFKVSRGLIVKNDTTAPSRRDPAK